MKIEHWLFQCHAHEETKNPNSNANNKDVNDEYANSHGASGDKFNEFGFKESPFMVHLMADVCKNLLPIIQMTDQLKLTPSGLYINYLF